MAKLVVFRGTRPEHYIDLTDRDLRIGRAPENDIVLEDPDRTVSRFHAELRYDNGGYTLIDLNSQNGLWIDGQRQPRVVLEPGRPVSIGTFRVLLQDAVEAPAPSDPTVAVPAATMVAPKLDAAAPPPAAPPAAPPPPAPAAAAAAPAAQAKKREPVKPKPQGEPVSLISKIARPKVFLSVLGVLVLLLVGRIMLDSGAPAEETTKTETPTTEPAETNEQTIARLVSEGRTKLNAGDYDGAIESAQKALVIDRDSSAAVELQIKAEEAKRAAAANPGGTATPPATTASDTPTSTASTESPATTSAGTTSTTQGASGTADPTKKATRPRKPVQQHVVSPYVVQQYTKAKAALDRGQYADAVGGFEAVLKAEPNYEDSEALLAQARTGLKAAAAEAVRAGQQLAASGDIAGAREQYQRARSMDPSAPGLSEAMASLAEQMSEAGRQAYRRARQYDALGRAKDAIPLYQQAVQFLPDTDPNKKVARDRLAALQGQ